MYKKIQTRRAPARSNFTQRARASLLLLALVLIGVNAISGVLFQSWRIDLTKENLFTLSRGTLETLAEMDEPITARLYFSKQIAEKSPLYASYYARVKELLEQYADHSGGHLNLELYNPEPFSDAEDRAVSFGLNGILIDKAGEAGYFGLAATNSVDNQEVLPFFNIERESFLEYDVTRLFHTLLHPKKTVVGLLSTLPIMGSSPGLPLATQAEPWVVVQQLRKQFDLRTIETTVSHIPEEVGLLMLVQHAELPEQTLYAIDQFVLGGGRLLAFVDPVAESATNPQDIFLRQKKTADKPNLDGLLNAWGVRLQADTLAGDLDAAHKVSSTSGNRSAVVPYVIWLALNQTHLDDKEIITRNIKTLNMASAGIIETLPEKETEVIPLVWSGDQSMAIEAKRVRMFPDPSGLLRSYKAEDRAFHLAVRIQGPGKTAFAEGRPPSEETEEAPSAQPQPPHQANSKNPINVVLVADTDLLSDKFWVRTQRFFGQVLLVPFANNADLMTNALDLLSGSEALIGLRGKGRSDRPFHRIEEIRLAAETRYRAKEKELQDKLQELQQKLNTLQRRGSEAQEALISEEQQQSIETFRNEMVVVRKALRTVKHELRKDIEQLESRLTFWNITGVPALFVLTWLTMLALRKSRVRQSDAPII